ncbi:ParA family protein [Vallitalea okinawensis]|uniref:ParA family protein n=1 Tax=Vallitalea okinawensis TaxID=2078660 RepID=UPI001300785C|nr:AAA family ATPase [Vallitalea okinawensis]
MQVAFWSNEQGQAGTTSNILAIAIMLALKYRYKVLLTHANFKKNTLEYSLLPKNYLQSDLMDLSDHGIDALSRFIRFNKVQEEDFENYTTSLLRNRLDLLVGTKATNKKIYDDEFAKVMKLILASAKNYYDLILIDLPVGKSPINEVILSSSDLIIINLNQNLVVLDSYFNNPLKLDNQIYLLGRYNPKSRFNKRSIKRRYNLKSHLNSIYYNIEFADACSEGKAIDFFLKNLDCKKEDSNYMFMQSVLMIANDILVELGLDLQYKKSVI